MLSIVLDIAVETSWFLVKNTIKGVYYGGRYLLGYENETTNVEKLQEQVNKQNEDIEQLKDEMKEILKSGEVTEK